MGLSTFLTKVVILYTMCQTIIGNKVSLPDISNLNYSNSKNECQRCKVLTDSFNYWLEKTSRGKFEGGDAAWEEAKLKSYARSEVRLVEIQEGLCSEVKKHQDQCYGLAEEAEHALEKWWFHEDSTSTDLYTWLCIETLQYCCPQNHYGESCTTCPLDQNNKMCGGHGRCDGDGTRMGNGSCICQRGYAGDYCERCAKNFYSVSTGSCKPCHRACIDCTAEGAAACLTCAPGWLLESGVCLDVDECTNPSNCNSNQYCINKEGSYTCKGCDTSCKTCAGAGPSNCTSCETNFVWWSGICVDDKLRNELLTDTIKRAALYCGLLLLTFFVFQKFKLLASLLVLVIAIYVYSLEKSSKMSMANVILNMYL